MFVMKHSKMNHTYIVIKAYKFTVSEILRDFLVLSYRVYRLYDYDNGTRMFNPTNPKIWIPSCLPVPETTRSIMKPHKYRAKLLFVEHWSTESESFNAFPKFALCKTSVHQPTLKMHDMSSQDLWVLL